MNGKVNVRTAHEPQQAGCHHIRTLYTYRNPFNEPAAKGLPQLCAVALEDEIVFQGPSTIVVFIRKPILGGGGVIPPHASFVLLVCEICGRNGIPLISDGVITGRGRADSWLGVRL